jgi:hypothetical protein
MRKDQQDALNAVKTLHPVWLLIATGAAKSSIKVDAQSAGWIQPGRPVSARASRDKKSVTAQAAAFFLTPISIDTKVREIDKSATRRRLFALPPFNRFNLFNSDRGLAAVGLLVPLQRCREWII